MQECYEKLWKNCKLYKNGGEAGEKTDPLKNIGRSSGSFRDVRAHRHRGYGPRLEWPSQRLGSSFC